MEADDLPRLENWYIASERLIGNVYNDKRFDDGEIISTTKIEWMNMDDGLAQTRNYLYRLGKKSVRGNV